MVLAIIISPRPNRGRMEIQQVPHRIVLTLTCLGLAIAGCGTSSASGAGANLKIVAGQNFWGSMATQLAGSHGTVQSVVTDPNADPHEYESNTNDARAFAEADLVILNGAGYDDWGKKLLDANSSSHRQVLNVAQLIGKKPGDNPHFSYDAQYVIQVADAMTAAYRSIDRADASYFDQQRPAIVHALQHD